MGRTFFILEHIILYISPVESLPCLHRQQPSSANERVGCRLTLKRMLLLLCQTSCTVSSVSVALSVHWSPDGLSLRCTNLTAGGCGPQHAGQHSRAEMKSRAGSPE